ncbi:MAG: hypothetical protein L0G87_00945 [Renibacterium salmoninarum]|nr:hypothetical protein [Renibacterium salmoninarum]
MALTKQPDLQITVIEPDGQHVEYTVRPDNRDRVRYDLIRERKGWPAMQAAPFVSGTVLAWSVLEREGKTTLDVEQFLANCTHVTAVDEAGDPLTAESIEQVQPFPKAQGSTSL